MRRRRILFKFRHGLGDAVQFTIVLRHLLHYRPDWEVDVACLWGKHSVFHGLCRRAYDEAEGWPDDGRYEEVIDVAWHESNVQQVGIPCTKASRFLLELGIEPVADLCRYWMADNPVAETRVRQWLDAMTVPRGPDGRYQAVVVHHQGNTAMDRKDITNIPILALAEAYVAAGFTVIVLDWDKRSWLPERPGVLLAPTGDQDIWGERGTGDAAGIRELIKACSLMVGIDSGPLHVAATTDTPTIALWRGHHPNRYFDLADNVTHYVQAPLLDDQTVDGHNLRTLYRTRRCAHHHGDQGIGELLGDLTGQDGETLHYWDFTVRREWAAHDLAIVYSIHTQDNYRFREFAATHDVKLVVDIGANIGAFSRLVKDVCPDARVIAVEANPHNAAVLRRNAGHLPGVEVIEGACTYEQAELILRDQIDPLPGGPGGWELVDKETEPGTRRPGCTYTYRDAPVTRVTLEQLVGQDQIDFLKLDCEGSEYSILRHTTCRPVLTACEWHRNRDHFERFAADVKDTWTFYPLAASGPDCFEHGHASVVPTRHDSPMPRYHPERLQIAVPPGIGDGAWCALYIESMLARYGVEQCDLHVCYGLPRRSVDYWSRFPFVATSRDSDYWCVRPGTLPDGIANYDRSGEGFHDCYDWLMVPNAELDRGQRIEECFPQFAINWNVHDQWAFRADELDAVAQLRRRIGPYVVFYCGSLENNTIRGHNRNELWKPEEWAVLARWARQQGLSVVLVGESYDRGYYEQKLLPNGIGEVHEAFGQWSIGTTLAVCKRAAALIAFQSGIGIVGLYMGCPVAMWWRPNGDSQDARNLVTLREEMATGWTPPDAVESGQYLPLIYTRCTPQTIIDHAESHWL